jgi:5-methylcytosine-specific restriction endonuclease McrA
MSKKIDRKVVGDLSDRLPATKRTTRKLTHEFIVDRFAEAGYEVLSEYVNNKTPIRFRCGNNHEHQLRWNRFQQGDRCAVCAGKHVRPEDVEKAFTEAGYELLGDYVSSKTPISFRCNVGHEQSITWGSFRGGRRCCSCFGNNPPLPEDVEGAFMAVGYELLGKYVNNHTPIKFQCANGHTHQLRWSDFLRGVRCAACAGKHVHASTVRDAFAAVGYEMLGDYVNSFTLVEFRCNNGHSHRISWDSFRGGRRCGICFTHTHHSKYVGKPALTRIKASIRREITRQNLSTDWVHYYDLRLLEEVAEPLNKIYEKCPKGHHVDHIIPASKFDLLDEAQLRSCWSPENLRYLPAIKNLSRGNRMTLKEVEMMSKKHPKIALKASRLDVNVPIQIPIDLSYGF